MGEVKLARIKPLKLANEKRLSQVLGISGEEIQALAMDVNSYYKPFELPPRVRPFSRKPPKKPRPIDCPTGRLKEIQKRINEAMLRPILMPEHIFGAVPHRTIIGNAQLHQGARVLVTLDIRQCFPSITNLHVYMVWSRVLGCSPSIAKLLTVLTTYRRHLPQGAPTSPLLANLFIWTIDKEIRRQCEEKGVRYSTWIDDLTFSGQRARELIQVVVENLSRHGLRVSHKKIRIMGPRATKLLTGTRFGRDAVRAPKEICSRARSGLHKLKLGLVPPEDVEGYFRRLSALILHIERICPRDAARLNRQLSDLSAI
jgi:RNA-directed DNA polymerase